MVNLWRDVTGNDEITSSCSKIKQNNNKELYGMAKYSGKDSDYLINQKYSMHFINHSKVNKFLFILVCLKRQERN